MDTHPYCFHEYVIIFPSLAPSSPPLAFTLKLQTAKVFYVPSKEYFLFPRAQWGWFVHMTMGYKVLIYTAECNMGIVGIFPSVSTA